MWTPANIEDARQRGLSTSRPENDLQDLDDLAVSTIMTRAVELVAARGGTMDAEGVMVALERFDAGTASIADSGRIRQHLAAQGATVAALEKERDNACQSEVVWRKRLEEAAEALSSVTPGEIGRLDIAGRARTLVAEMERLKKEEAGEHVNCGPSCPGHHQ
jgi:hypothetical protein